MDKQRTSCDSFESWLGVGVRIRIVAAMAILAWIAEAQASPALAADLPPKERGLLLALRPGELSPPAYYETDPGIDSDSVVLANPGTEIQEYSFEDGESVVVKLISPGEADEIQCKKCHGTLGLRVGSARQPHNYTIPLGHAYEIFTDAASGLSYVGRIPYN